MIGVLLACGLSLHPSIGKCLEKMDERIFNLRLLIRNPVLFFSARNDDADFFDVDSVTDTDSVGNVDPDMNGDSSQDTNSVPIAEPIANDPTPIPSSDASQETPHTQTVTEDTKEVTLEETQEVPLERPVDDPIKQTLEEPDTTTKKDENVTETDHLASENDKQQSVEENQTEMISEEVTADLTSYKRINATLDQMNKREVGLLIRFGRSMKLFQDLGIPKLGNSFWVTGGRHVNYTFSFPESDVVGVEFLYNGTDNCQSHNYSAIGIPGTLQNDIFVFEEPHRLSQMVVTATNDGNESVSCLYGCNMLVK